MTRVRPFAVLLFSTAVACAGCHRGRVLAGKPSVGNGIRVEVAGEVKIKGSTFSAELIAVNDTAEKIEINRNQIAVVAPDGREFYREGSRELHWLEAHDKHDINLDVTIDPAAFANAKGIYLRFDGFYVRTLRIDVPPMALGQPTGSPGRTNPSFVSSTAGQPAKPVAAAAPAAKPDDKPKAGIFRRMYNAARGTDSTEAPAAAGAATGVSEASPPPTDGSMQQYRGPRRQLRTAGLKCAAMPLKTKSVAPQMAFIMDELLLSELQASGFEAIGPDDINALIGFEKTKEAVGCDDMSCVAEIGSALGVPYLAAGNVAVIEGSVVITLKLLDTKTPRVVARVNKVAEGGQKGLPRVIAEAVQELVERSNL